MGIEEIMTMSEMKARLLVAMLIVVFMGCKSTTKDQCKVYVELAVAVAKEVAALELNGKRAKERFAAYGRIVETAAPLGCDIPALKLAD